MLINLKKATMDDVEYILNIRNDLDIRLSSGVSKVVSEEEHREWFENFLSKKDHYYFIGELKHKPIGVVRFQPYNGLSSKTEISITIYPQTNQKKGYGTNILLQGIDFIRKQTDNKEIIARVLKSNPHSLDFFRKNNFTPFLHNENYVFLKVSIK